MIPIGTPGKWVVEAYYAHTVKPPKKPQELAIRVEIRCAYSGAPGYRPRRDPIRSVAT